MTKSLKNLSDEVYLSHDDPFIDFSSAGLYLVGLQTTVATVACAATSVASCWLMPNYMVSAVRTLAITALVGFMCMRKPIRVGRVRGVTTIFNALRPCVVIYISVLTIEQLVHTCVALDAKPHGYSRHIVFHSAISIMAAAGFWRAARPMSETDAPFLMAVLCVVVIAMLPPPAQQLSGPLCESASLFAAGDRLLRGFFFAALYVIHVYCSPPSRNSIHDLAVCVMRCAAAAVWVLGCHLFVIWVPLVQAVVALWARFGHETPSGGNYSNVDTRSDSGLSDAELGGLSADYQLPRDSNGVLIAPYMRSPLNAFTHSDTSPMEQQHVGVEIGVNGVNGMHGMHGMHGMNGMNGIGSGGGTPTPAQQDGGAAVGSDGVPVTPQQLASLVAGRGGGGLNSTRMAQIAATLK